MKRQLILSLLSAISLAPAASLAQPASIAGLDFQPTIGDWELPYEKITNSVKGISSPVGDKLADAVTKDVGAMCKQVGLGTEVTERSGSNYDYARGSSNSSGGGGGGLNTFLGISIGGSGSSSDANTWDNGNGGTWKNVSSNVVVGRDCSNVTDLLGRIETSRMDNDTRRLGILVGNETQRYDIDKRTQVALKQIQAGQIQNVFGGAANAMMGSMAR